MVTLKDIAAACGVSPATVSRAVNADEADMSGRAERIRQVAREMGYRPNAAARALKTNRSNSIGILYEDLMNHEYFSALLDAVRREAEARGYDLTFLARSEDGRVDDYDMQASYRNIDGILILRADFTAPRITHLVKGSRPIVVIDHTFDTCDSVESDNSASVEQLVSLAHERGHRRLAFIRGESGTVTDSRVSGFYKGCAELGIRVPPEYMVQGQFRNPELCTSLILRLMALPEPPTCILCPDDFSCIGAMTALAPQGIHVPEDISLVGYDGIWMAKMMRPALTTYEQNTGEVARIAVTALLDAIENPDSHRVAHRVVQGAPLPGETVRRLA